MLRSEHKRRQQRWALRAVLAATVMLWVLPASAAVECVVLLHGLIRSSGSMETMAEALRTANYRVVNVDYPSTSAPVEVLAGDAIGPALELCGETAQVHFVTHSLGGILVRTYLAKETIARLGHVVMLGPPNQGSELVDEFATYPGFGLLNGAAGGQLGTGPDALPARLGPVAFSLGVIAGTRSYNPLYSSIIPGPDDGKVSVTSTRVVGMSDAITLAVSHSFMMDDHQVIAQTLYFLQTGRFIHSSREPV